MHNGSAPSDPKPGALHGFSLQGGNAMPIRMRTDNNGVVDEITGLMTQWSLRADRAGTFSLGPAGVPVSMRWEQSRFAATTHGEPGPTTFTYFAIVVVP